MTHLIDTSVWHRYARSAEVRNEVDRLVSTGALLTTCPVVVAEYCFSARNEAELSELQTDMELLYLLESSELNFRVEHIQSALWSTGLIRAAGASGTLIAAYALNHNQTIVTCDVDYVHIARALEASATKRHLRVIHVTEPSTTAADS